MERYGWEFRGNTTSTEIFDRKRSNIEPIAYCHDVAMAERIVNLLNKDAAASVPVRRRKAA